MSSILQDVRFATRMLVRDPAFSLLTVATLALGIGATVAVFSVVWRVLLSPLPFPESDRLMVIWETHPEIEYSRMVAAPPNVDDWARESKLFERFGVYTSATFVLTDGDRNESLSAAQVTASLLEAVGVRPQAGRALVAADQANASLRPILISDRIWREWFGGAADAIGRRVRLDGRDAEIVGVMPASFQFPPPLTFVGLTPERRHDLWVPFQPAPLRGAHYVMALGRLRPGVAPLQADQELKAIAQRIADANPENRGWSTRVVPLQEELASPVRPGIVTLFAAVGMVLLLACGNVANLFLARGLNRRREMAIRAALGAGRRRLVRQLAIETLTAAIAGGAGGLLLAAWGVRLAVAFGPATVPRLGAASVDARAVLFALAVSMLSALVVGILPALVGTGARPVESLRSRTGSDGRTGGLQRTLVSGQIAVALVLLVASLVLINGFLRLRGVQLGFRTHDVVSMRLALAGERYAKNEARVAALTQILERLQASPEVLSAGASDSVPLSGSRQGSYVSRGDRSGKREEGVSTRYSFITPGYFETIGTPLLHGRLFEKNESSKPGPILLNETAARRLFADTDPLGRQVLVGFEDTPRVVVGVVGDERHVGPARPPDANVYIPAFQYGWTARLTIVARTAGSTDAALNRLNAVARDVDPSLAPYDARALRDMASDVVATERFLTLLLAGFAAVALALSAIGVYGVMTCYVTHQMHDYGVRLALGARGMDIARSVLGHVAIMSTAGLVPGVLLLMAVRRYVAGIIPGSPDVTVAFAAAALVLLPLLALGAALRPAHRAMSADPLVALRQE